MSRPVAPARRRLTVVIIVAATLLMGAAWWRVRFLERATMSGWRAALDGGATTTRTTIDDWYAERADDALALGENIARIRASARDPASLRQLIEPTLRRGRYLGIWVVDASGAIRAGGTSDSLFLAERNAAAWARRENGLAVSPITIDGRGTSSLALAVPVPAPATAAEADDQAVLVLRLDVVAAFSPWARGRANAVMSELVSPAAHGVVIVRVCPGQRPPVCVRAYEHIDPNSAEGLALAGVDTFGVFRDADDATVLATTVYDRTFRWGVVRRVSRHDAFAPFRKELAIESLALALALGFLGIAAFAADRATRVRRLDEQARADARLATALDASTDGLLSIDGAFVITMVNGAVERMFGAPREALVGAPVTSLFALEWRDHIRDRLDGFVRSSDPQRSESVTERAMAERADGSKFSLDARLGSAMLDGIPLYTMGLHDVSERVRSDAFTQGQRAVLELIAAGAPAAKSLDMLVRLVESETPSLRCAIFELDEGGAIARLVCAPRFGQETADLLEEIVVGPAAGVVGTAVHRGEAVYSLDVATDAIWAGRRDAVLAHGIRAGWAIPLRGAHGQVIGAFASYADEARGPTPLERELGRAAVHLASIALSSAHDAASLRTSEASFRSFVENAPAAIFRETRRGHLVSANPAMTTLLGYASSDALVQAADVGLLYHDHAARRELLDALEQSDVVRNREIEWRRADGSRVTVRLSARAYRDDRGSVWLWEGFAEDVTALRSVSEALRRSEKLAAVGQLISGVAHELNNPLSSILHFAEDLLADRRPPEDAEALGVIRDQARRSRAIVRDLLSFVHRRDAPVEPLVLSIVAAETARGIRPMATAAGTRLHVEVEGDETVLGDRAGLEQVITNLLANALHAAGEGGDVWVRTEHDSTSCRLVVEDSGPGIPAEVMRRIFDPFFTTKPTGEGTGLGLSVSLGIVEQLGGTIQASSRDGGSGARFIVTLPCAGSAGSDAIRELLDAAGPRATGDDGPRGALFTRVAVDQIPSSPARPVVAARGGSTEVRRVDSLPNGQRALIIDDEPTIRAALRRYFARRGWQVEEAADGRAAMALLEDDAERFSVIVSDLRMPGFSGVELHDRLAEERPALLERMVFSTGDVASEEAASFVSRTACPVLQKPFELRALDDIVARLSEGAGAPPGVS